MTLLQERVKKSLFVVTPVETGVQAVRKGRKILDSDFRRNDGKGSQVNFFTRSKLRGINDERY